MVRGKHYAEREGPSPPLLHEKSAECVHMCAETIPSCPLRVPLHSPRDLSIHRDSHRVHCTTGATTLVEAERTSSVKGLDMPPPLPMLTSSSHPAAPGCSPTFRLTIRQPQRCIANGRHRTKALDSSQHSDLRLITSRATQMWTPQSASQLGSFDIFSFTPPLFRRQDALL